MEKINPVTILLGIGTYFIYKIYKIKDKEYKENNEEYIDYKYF